MIRKGRSKLHSVGLIAWKSPDFGLHQGSEQLILACQPPFIASNEDFPVLQAVFRTQKAILAYHKNGFEIETGTSQVSFCPQNKSIRSVATKAHVIDCDLSESQRSSRKKGKQEQSGERKRKVNSPTLPQSGLLYVLPLSLSCHPIKAFFPPSKRRQQISQPRRNVTMLDSETQHDSNNPVLSRDLYEKILHYFTIPVLLFLIWLSWFLITRLMDPKRSGAPDDSIGAP